MICAGGRLNEINTNCYLFFKQRGYQPAQIAIGNYSDHRISVSTKDIDLPVIPAKEVANWAHFSTVKRTFKYMAVGLIAIWGTVGVLTSVTSNILWAPFMPIFLTLYAPHITIPIFLFSGIIPGMVARYKTFRANRKMDKDYAQKEFSDCLLAPDQIVQGIIFVPIHEFKPEFSCIVTDEDTHISYKLSTDRPCVDIT
jgi:hypothetical protein